VVTLSRLVTMTQLKIKWNKDEFDVTVDEGTTVEVFKTQMWTLTQVPTDKQKYLGFPGGMLKDSDDFMAKVAKVKPGAKITMMGTPEGGELKEPAEKVVFEEDLTPEEKARILKEKKVEVPPAGIKNLGNTCYMNATIQVLTSVKDLTTSIQAYEPPPGDARDIDAVLTNQFKNVLGQLGGTTDAIMPLQFVMALRTRFPRFAEMQNGVHMQQDADECLRGLFTVFSSALPGGKVDQTVGFQMQSTLKCLECDEEEPQTSQEMQHVLLCHLGTQTDPVSHIHQGVQLSLKEHVEKSSPALGRNAQYEKQSVLTSLPPYLVVQFARFGYKGANDWAGTSASKVKLTRKCAFSSTFDIFDCTDGDLKKRLSAGRLKKKEQEDEELERERKAAKTSSSSSAPAEDADMKPVEDVEMKPGTEEWDTGYYELVSIISHKGRTADGGHYVGWVRHKKAKSVKEDDQWILFDDDETQFVNWKDMVGMSTDLQGGKADTQIAYINIYKKVTVTVEAGQKLGGKEEDGEKAEASGSATEAAPSA